ncbi:MAG: hypothetical protein WCJ02_04040 [bacterium]
MDWLLLKDNPKISPRRSETVGNPVNPVRKTQRNKGVPERMLMFNVRLRSFFMRCLIIALAFCLVGCHSIKNKTPEETLYYLGCPEKLLPVNRAKVMRISKNFWTETDKKVWNSFSKEEWEEMMLLLARIPPDCIHERTRIVQCAYHVVYNTEGKPVGVSIALFLGEEIPLVRSKDGQWKILNIIH